MTIKNEVLIRVYIVLFLVVLAAILIFGRAIQIAVVEGEKWRKKGDYTKFRKVEAERGNILTEDGSLLATSLPFFDIAFDPVSSGMEDEDWNENIDTLTHCLANMIDAPYTVGGYKTMLEQKRADSVKYVPIKKNATLAEMELISQFPLFKLGQFKGGFIAERKYSRETPFGILADRTIGYVHGDSTKIGLEGYFDDILRGEEGKQLMNRLPNGIWIPVNDLAKIEPKSGQDIVTTIDINLQDIVETALIRAMERHKPKYGVAILMEVKTGAIRAIANLGFNKRGYIQETYNDAVGSATEPGSTYKLAAIMALLEDELVTLEDSIVLDKGVTEFYEERMEDAVSHGLDTTSVRRAFEVSSNVGIAKLIHEHYGLTGKGADFIKRLKQFHLHEPTGIEIRGEGTPYLKEAYSQADQWSGTSLPWMSIGYEVTITPLQLLTFYNTVANDGVMMKPQLVREIQQFGETVKKFPTIQIRKRIASRKTVALAKELLEGVVEKGTAKKMKSSHYRFAGKTGTAQRDYKKLADRTLVGGYQASFAGWFPAEDPMYSCIVLISEPQEGGYYGSQVALPVFREIADRTFATEVDLFPAINEYPKPILAKNLLPDYDVGHRQDMQTVLSYLDFPFVNQTANEWAVIRATETDSLKLLRRTISDERVPNVVGMGLRDALYILENLGLQVTITGYGKVRKQSLKPGTSVNGQTIQLTLR